MMQIERIWEFLQRLTPVTRSCLLTELERLELCGVEMPGSADIQAKLRAEFRKDGSSQGRGGDPARYFFAALEPVLVNSAPEHENCGRIPRGSLAPIWEWINRDLLPTMARDYVDEINKLTAADKQKELRKAAATFQTKVLKYLENALGSPEAVTQTRAKLATYTASPSAYHDLTKMMCVLRTRDALAKFNDALPANIEKFDDAMLAKVTALLKTLGKEHADAVPFGLALIGKRLKTSWHLIYLATKAAPSKKAADIAAMPYAIAVSMVLDQVEDARSALRVALRKNRVLVARSLLVAIYDTEHALQVRINELDASQWGARLRKLMDAIAALVEEEVSRFPDEVGHVLGSSSLRGGKSLTRRLSYMAWKGRDAFNSSVASCMKLVS
ncbi:MAG: hypothetical protein E6G93_00530 [Alphaproteobacteria bacterium]|nr:MAG: hypothetical protein E6G93_00530 [Alphaproteobacteria bacterium]